MSLVYDVYLGLRVGGGESGAFAQRADVVDPAVGCGVDLDQIQRSPGLRRLAGGTGAARLAIQGTLAVQGPVQDAGEAGLAGAAGTTEKICMRHGPAHHGVLQRADDRFLADHVAERTGPPAEVEGTAVRGWLARFGGHARYPAAVSAT